MLIIPILDYLRTKFDISHTFTQNFPSGEERRSITINFRLNLALIVFFKVKKRACMTENGQNKIKNDQKITRACLKMTGIDPKMTQKRGLLDNSSENEV